jgi:SAM-dependent methyltransferase
MPSPLADPSTWDLVAPDYDDLIVPLFRPFSARALELLARPDGASVLDVACGPGTAPELLLQAGPRVDAVDFAPNMIAQLEHRVGEYGRGTEPRLRARVMDGQSLEFESNAFDGALSMFGLMFFPDRQRGFSELCRVLKPGARAAVSSWLPLSAVPAMQWGFGAFGAITPPPPADAPPRVPILEDPLVFAEEMTRAGFRDVRVERVMASMPVESIEAFWDGMVKSSAPIRLFRSKLTDEQWVPLNERALAHLRQTAPADLSALRMEAWIGVGTKG